MFSTAKANMSMLLRFRWMYSRL